MTGVEGDRKAFVVGALDERRAVSRFLVVRAARALVNTSKLPWWAFRRRRIGYLSANVHAQIATEIENGQHVTDQAVWLVDLDGGIIIGREAFRAPTPTEAPHDPAYPS